MCLCDISSSSIVVVFVWPTELTAPLQPAETRGRKAERNTRETGVCVCGYSHRCTSFTDQLTLISLPVFIRLYCILQYANFQYSYHTNTNMTHYISQSVHYTNEKLYPTVQCTKSKFPFMAIILLTTILNVFITLLYLLDLLFA